METLSFWKSSLFTIPVGTIEEREINNNDFFKPGEVYISLRYSYSDVLRMFTFTFTCSKAMYREPVMTPEVVANWFCNFAINIYYGGWCRTLKLTRSFLFYNCF